MGKYKLIGELSTSGRRKRLAKIRRIRSSFVDLQIVTTPTQRGSTSTSNLNSSECRNECSSECSTNSETDYDSTDSESDSESFDNSENVHHTHKSELNINPVLWFRIWIDKHGVYTNAIDELLPYLKKFEPFQMLPKRYTTLMQTPKSTEIIDVFPGKYTHIGLKLNLDRLMSAMETKPSEIVLQFNVDGASIWESTQGTFWPILGRATNLSTVKLKAPFVVGLYYGLNKPKDYDQLLTPFVDEMLELIESYSFDDIVIKVILQAIICDAPARAAVVGIKQHNGEVGCGKCVVRGTWLGKMTFQSHDNDLRTNENFRLHIDEDHHNRISIIEKLPIDMVCQIPNDYMHLVLLGVMKKLVNTWIAVKTGYFAAASLDSALNVINDVQPSDFQRKARSLKQFGKFKASECRTFLLYIGPVIFKGVLPPDVYEHFLLLHTSIRILCCSDLIVDNLQCAQAMLRTFVEDFGDIYGEDELVYNVHSLIHLCADAEIFGTLDEFSAFPFENFIGSLKKKIHHGRVPLQQVSNRLHESIKIPIIEKKTINADYLLGKAENTLEGIIYKKIVFPNKGFTIAAGDRNCWFLTKSKNILKFLNAEERNGNIFIRGEVIQRKDSFFNLPIDSSRMNIFIAAKHNNLRRRTFKIKYIVDSIIAKLFAIQDENDQVFFPLLH
jgi:hypothetical protein